MKRAKPEAMLVMLDTTDPVQSLKFSKIKSGWCFAGKLLGTSRMGSYYDTASREMSSVLSGPTCGCIQGVQPTPKGIRRLAMNEQRLVAFNLFWLKSMKDNLEAANSMGYRRPLIQETL